jgi:hypothetical protein
MLPRDEGIGLKNFVTLLFPTHLREIGRRLVAELAVYIDDSGDENLGIVIAAGYVAEVDRWATFSNLWQALLAKAEVPVNEYGIRVFHSKEFAHSHTDSKSPFYRWTQEQKNEFMSWATHLIVGLTLNGAGKGFSVAVPVKEYRQIQPSLGPPIRPFTFAVLQAMKEVERWTNQRGIHDPITYFFDKVPRHSGAACKMMNEVEQSIELRKRFRYAQWSWSSRHKHSALQAADILAYESFQELTKGVLLNPPQEQRKSLIALDPSNILQTLFTEASLQDFLSQALDAEEGIQ